MDYEKRYEKLVDAVKVLRDNNPSDEGIQNWVNDNVPELKESEGEKIRKWLIAQLELKSDINNQRDLELMILKAIAWLEKQGEVDNPHNYLYGERKSVDKVKPKFKVGDWVVDDYGLIWKIGGILKQFYLLEGVGGGESRPTIERVDKTYHLWSLKDAKDGDVLVASDDSVFIYAGSTDIHAQFYIALTKYGDFNTKGGNWEDKNCVKPATKEQRDLLFQKMKEAGYEWDAKNKELNKIEDEPVTIIPKFKVGDIIRHKKQGFTCKITAVDTEYRLSECNGTHLPFDCQDYYELVDENPAWSEEDEENLNQLHKLIVKKAYEEYEIDTEDETLWGKHAILDNWLKSLKERIKGGH